MNTFKDEINSAFEKIRKTIENNQPLTAEELKIILLNELNEEDLHEGKQQ